MASLPAPVRTRVLGLASDHLGTVAPDLVPIGLRAVARFTPAKRARLGSSELAAALDADAVFRQGVASRAKTAQPELAAALLSGDIPAAADPDDVAALAYLLRVPGWEELVAAVATSLAVREASRADAAGLDAVLRLTEQLEAVRATGRTELAAAREQQRAGEAELVAARKKIREIGDRAGRAEQGQRVAEAALLAAQDEAAALRAARAVELRAWEDRLTDAERATVDARQAVRGGQKDDQLRLRLLLDALVGAAQGLRRELALPPAEGRPADALTADYAVSGPALQGRSDDDPLLLDALLALPTAHLMVDGYNVTKTGYPALPLEAQRTRLVAGLGGLAARTGAEVTVVFDGSDGVAGLKAAAPRGVRVVFSRTGETADEVLRRYAAHEPQGRPVVVASSDKEVAAGVRRSGARPVPAVALVRLLERGGSVGPGS